MLKRRKSFMCEFFSSLGIERRYKITRNCMTSYFRECRWYKGGCDGGKYLERKKVRGSLTGEQFIVQFGVRFSDLYSPTTFPTWYEAYLCSRMRCRYYEESQCVGTRIVKQAWFDWTINLIHSVKSQEAFIRLEIHKRILLHPHRRCEPDWQWVYSIVNLTNEILPTDTGCIGEKEKFTLTLNKERKNKGVERRWAELSNWNIRRDFSRCGIDTLKLYLFYPHLKFDRVHTRSLSHLSITDAIRSILLYRLIQLLASVPTVS